MTNKADRTIWGDLEIAYASFMYGWAKETLKKRRKNLCRLIEKAGRNPDDYMPVIDGSLDKTP